MCRCSQFRLEWFSHYLTCPAAGRVDSCGQLWGQLLVSIWESVQHTLQVGTFDKLKRRLAWRQQCSVLFEETGGERQLSKVCSRGQMSEVLDLSPTDWDFSKFVTTWLPSAGVHMWHPLGLCC